MTKIIEKFGKKRFLQINFAKYFLCNNAIQAFQVYLAIAYCFSGRINLSNKTDIQALSELLEISPNQIRTQIKNLRKLKVGRFDLDPISNLTESFLTPFSEYTPSKFQDSLEQGDSLTTKEIFTKKYKAANWFLIQGRKQFQLTKGFPSPQRVELPENIIYDRKMLRTWMYSAVTIGCIFRLRNKELNAVRALHKKKPKRFYSETETSFETELLKCSSMNKKRGAASKDTTPLLSDCSVSYSTSYFNGQKSLEISELIVIETHQKRKSNDIGSISNANNNQFVSSIIENPINKPFFKGGITETTMAIQLVKAEKLGFIRRQKQSKEIKRVTISNYEALRNELNTCKRGMTYGEQKKHRIVKRMIGGVLYSIWQYALPSKITSCLKIRGAGIRYTSAEKEILGYTKQGRRASKVDRKGVRL